MCAKLLQLCLTLCNLVECSSRGPLSMVFSRQEYWSGLPCPPAGDLPDPGIDLGQSLLAPALAGGFFTTTATWEANTCMYTYSFFRFISVITKYWEELPMLYSRSLGVILYVVVCICQCLLQHCLQIARTWKHPECPSTAEWMKKIWYIYTQWNITKPWKRVASYGSVSSISRKYWWCWVPWRFFSLESNSCFLRKPGHLGWEESIEEEKGESYDLVEPRTEFESQLIHLLILGSYLCDLSEFLGIGFGEF